MKITMFSSSVLSLAVIASTAGKAWAATLRSGQTKVPMKHKAVSREISMISFTDGATGTVQVVYNRTEALKAMREGPATLKEYCSSGGDPAVDEGEKVMADWKGYGTLYPGEVKDTHKNGTYDIIYDDGWTEKIIPEKRIDEVDANGNPIPITPKPSATRQEDGACQLNDDLQEIKKDIVKVQKQIATWTIAQRAKAAGGKSASATAARNRADNAGNAPGGLAPAPSAAQNPDADASSELAKLKETLAKKDAEIAGLEDQVAANDKALEGLKGAAPSAAPSGEPKTVDELIADYKSQIAARDERIKELKSKLADQEQELASLGAYAPTLEEILAAVEELNRNIAAAKKKRDELEKNGKLDPELQVCIDGITESMEKMNSKVALLKELEAKARAKKEKADKKKADAEAAAQEAAALEKEGDADGAKLAKEKFEAAEKELEEDDEQTQAADMEVISAAAAVEDDLHQVDAGANKLDTGVHPHGDKWWRYRYEHSYIEALIMICVALLMAFYHQVCRIVREQVKAASLKASDELVEVEENVHYDVYTKWLEKCGIEIAVCVFTMLTVWIASKTNLWEGIPDIMPSTDIFHLPTTGFEYKILSIDVCVIVLFAIILYLALIFSVVHACAGLIKAVNDFAFGRGFGAVQESFNRAFTLRHTLATDIANWKSFFLDNVKLEMQQPDRAKLYEDYKTAYGDDFDSFPFSSYLGLNIRLGTSALVRFGSGFWLMIVVTFAGLCVCHRRYHMGYVRIMGCYLTLCFCIMLFMMFYINKNVNTIKDGKAIQEPAGGLHTSVNTEELVCLVLHYSLFIACYGAARVICQRWMWELHFYPVLFVTLMTIVIFLCFTFLVAPIIPSFCCVMSMPPYLDPENIKQMTQVTKLEIVTKSGTIPLSARS